jgi:hypothetical protein
MKSVIYRVINKLIELDEDIIVKLHMILPEPKSYLVLHKDYNEDEFFQRYISIYEILDWVSLFGVEMTCIDILQTFNEEMEDCFG